MHHRLAAAVADLVLPATCAACGTPARSLCDACATDLLAGLVRFGGPTWVAPDPVPQGWPGCVAVTAYDGVARTLVAGYKDDDRRDARRLLAPLLAAAVLGACRGAGAGGAGAGGDGAGGVVLVPAPSSPAARRRRGRDCLGELTRAAATLLPGSVQMLGLLAQTRRVRDQAGLGAADRRANLAGAVTVRRAHRGRLDGLSCLLVDDVVTTGATLVECARALSEEGGTVIGAATVCATSRTSPRVGTRLGRGQGAASGPVLSVPSLEAGREFADDLSRQPPVG